MQVQDQNDYNIGIALIRIWFDKNWAFFIMIDGHFKICLSYFGQALGHKSFDD